MYPHRPYHLALTCFSVVFSGALYAKKLPQELPQEYFYIHTQVVEKALRHGESISPLMLSDTLKTQYKNNSIGPWTVLKSVAAQADDAPTWDIHDEKILRLADVHGRTMAHELAGSYKLNWITTNPDILKLVDDQGVTVAHELAKNNSYSSQKSTCVYAKQDQRTVVGCPLAIKPWGSDDFSILSLADKTGKTVAHVLASTQQSEWDSQDPAVLLLKDATGWSVAHALAENPAKNWNTNDIQILKLVDNTGISVVHTLAGHTLGLESPASWKHNEKDILSLYDGSGRSVAHILAFSTTYKLVWTTTDADILKLKAIDGVDHSGNMNIGGGTVAHVLARTHKWQTDDLDILKLTEPDGKSVAHELAFYNDNWSPKDPTILLWREKTRNETVAHILAKMSDSWTTHDPTILKLQDEFGDSVALALAENTQKKPWTTTDPEILALVNQEHISVAQVLKVNQNKP